MNQAEIVRLYNDNMSIDAIARKAGCSRNPIRKHLLDAGVTLRAYTPPRKDIDTKKIFEMREQGLSCANIARHFNCSVSCIQARLKKKNSKPKSQNVKRKKMCSCCGINPIPKKPVRGHLLTRLCYSCFTRERETE